MAEQPLSISSFRAAFSWRCASHGAGGSLLLFGSPRSLMEASMYHPPRQAPQSES